MSRAPALPTLTLDTPLDRLRGVGPARAAALAAAGLATVGDLVRHLPSRHEDRRAVAAVGEALGTADGAEVTVRGRLRDLVRVRGRRRGFAIVRGRVEDDGGSLPVVWFNRPYLAALDVTAGEFLLHGRVRDGRRGRELVNPSCEPAGAGAVHGGRVVPVYPAIGPLGPALLRRLIGGVVERLDLAEAVAEPLPAELLARHRLPPLGAALATLHRPDRAAGGGPGAEPGEAGDPGAPDVGPRLAAARDRLVYGELHELQLALALARRRQVGRRQRFRHRVDDRVRRVAREVLPFRLTGAQKRVVREIVDDLRRPYPMLRLLQGDVGSGKTVVAALALVVTLESGLQAAFMAPTELLAEQHFAALERLLGGRYRLALLTASAGPALEERRAAVAAGEVDLAVGTHALIQESVRFGRLGLAVIDEQHRFGVEQRRLLAGKGDRPDVLVMTATPIPRSLALTLYGDLEVSTLDELPPGRSPVATEVVPRGRRRAVYRRLAAELEAGGRAYVVCPSIEAGAEAGAASLEREGAEVRGWLAGHPVGVLHGRLPAAERDAAIHAFAAGELRALVATTVVEVGIDVPEATVMVIESAERFGLAQLHQLRGRVGRGSRPSRCVAIHGRLTPEARRRLEVFAGTTDGFAIAEADLQIRGPGDLVGTRQAGLPELRTADLVRDVRWLAPARDDARELVGRLGEPALAPLAARLAGLPWGLGGG